MKQTTPSMAALSVLNQIKEMVDLDQMNLEENE